MFTRHYLEKQRIEVLGKVMIVFQQIHALGEVQEDELKAYVHLNHDYVGITGKSIATEIPFMPSTTYMIWSNGTIKCDLAKVLKW